MTPAAEPNLRVKVNGRRSWAARRAGRRRRWAWAWVAAPFLLGWPGHVWGQASGDVAPVEVVPEAGAEASLAVGFSYRAPAECMKEAEAFSLVQRRSHRVRRDRRGLAPQKLQMTIVREGGAYRGELVVRRGQGAAETRAMTGGHCDDVVEGLALTAALSIDPHATLTLGPARESPERNPSSEEGGEGGRASEAAQSSAGARGAQTNRESADPLVEGEARSRAGSQGVMVSLGATVVVERVVEQSVDLGGGITALVSGTGDRSLFPLEFRASLHIVTETRTRNSEGIYTDLFVSRLAYCPFRFGREHSLALCGGIDLGALRAQSLGFEQPTDATRFYSSATMEAWLKAQLTAHWQLWLAPALTVPLTERQFGVDPGPEILNSTVDLGWRVTTGLGWAF